MLAQCLAGVAYSFPFTRWALCPACNVIGLHNAQGAHIWGLLPLLQAVVSQNVPVILAATNLRLVGHSNPAGLCGKSPRLSARLMAPAGH